jgi:hypothetical protein
MIKATISNETKRNAFAKLGAKKIAGGTCAYKPSIRGLTLDKYKSLGSSICTLQKNNDKNLENIIIFSHPKEVA